MAVNYAREMSREELEAKSLKHGTRGVKVIFLPASGKLALMDTWSRLIPRWETGLNSSDPSGTPLDECGDFGFAYGELEAALVYLRENYDFSMPKGWGMAQGRPKEDPLPAASKTLLSLDELGI